jgi:hypothetical protein
MPESEAPPSVRRGKCQPLPKECLATTRNLDGVGKGCKEIPVLKANPTTTSMTARRSEMQRRHRWSDQRTSGSPIFASRTSRRRVSGNHSEAAFHALAEVVAEGASESGAMRTRCSMNASATVSILDKVLLMPPIRGAFFLPSSPHWLPSWCWWSSPSPLPGRPTLRTSRGAQRPPPGAWFRALAGGDLLQATEGAPQVVLGEHGSEGEGTAGWNRPTSCEAPR